MPDANGNPQPGDPGYVAPGSGLMSAAATGQNTPNPNPAVTTYQPAQASPTKATATSYDATPYQVSPNQTVAEQVRQVIGEDSPLIQQAEAKAAQDMNDRGLRNSSLAVGASQQAILNAALPIAQQDASTYNQNEMATAAAENTASQTNAAAQNTATNLNASLGTDVSKTNAGAINTQLGQASTSALQTTLETMGNTTQTIIAGMNNATQLSGIQMTQENQLAIDKLDNATKTSIATLQAQNQNLLQTNSNAASMYGQTVLNIANISQSSTMDPQSKNDAITSQLNLLNEGLKQAAAVAATNQAAIASLNLDQYFAGGGNIIPLAA